MVAKKAMDFMGLASIGLSEEEKREKKLYLEVGILFLFAFHPSSFTLHTLTTRPSPFILDP